MIFEQVLDSRVDSSFVPFISLRKPTALNQKQGEADRHLQDITL